MPPSSAAKPPKFDFAFHPDASAFDVTLQTYVNTHPNAGFDHIGTGALVFDTGDPATPRILLIQRAATDSMPNEWEIPGGACDDEDESILYGVARELWEEAGLKAIYISGPVGDPHLFRTRSGKEIGKFIFPVRVDADVNGRLEVRLDPAEHQQSMWASESEVRLGRAGDVDLKFTAKELQDTILQAFSQYAKN